MRKSEFVDKELLKEKDKSDLKEDWLLQFIEEATDNVGEVKDVQH